MITYPSNHAEYWLPFLQQAMNSPRSTIADLFYQEPNRPSDFLFYGAGISADLSRQAISSSELKFILKLASNLQLPQAIKRMFDGEVTNHTEHRAALHTALRHPQPEQYPEIKDTLDKIESITNKLHQKNWHGHSGQVITDIVNIGIGGSDLGPKMACSALNKYHNPNVRVHFASNADLSDIHSTLSKLNPETTAFIVVSKSWSTQETQINGQHAKNWLIESGCPFAGLSQHFIAITTKIDQAKQFGVTEEFILPMWDWVGGRFSLWSAAGISISLATSFEHFKALLAGAHSMDQHFLETPLHSNLPALLACTEIWNVNILERHSQAVIPYNHDLRLLPEHLQQLIMESNGKSTNQQNQSINYQTCPIIWGSAGTVGQHSYHQLLHQGNEVVPIDFVLPLKNHVGNQTDHNLMIANCLAQAEVLMDGLSPEEIFPKLLEQGLSEKEAATLAEHKAMPGNRPSTIISFNLLTPETLGALIALYEHKVFCSSVLWNINPFDQWGVELGKTVAADLLKQINNNDNNAHNPATQASLHNMLNSINPQDIS